MKHPITTNEIRELGKITEELESSIQSRQTGLGNCEDDTLCRSDSNAISADVHEHPQRDISVKVISSINSADVDIPFPYKSFCRKWCPTYSWRCSKRETCEYNVAVRR